MHPRAVVMNMFYTGLGIVRSLGEQGIPVIGLSAHRIYGNHTRYAGVRRCPDSREEPDRLLGFLLRLGEEIGGRNVLFPTRDDDCVFLDRFRGELAEHFVPVVPPPHALRGCLNKWETYGWARKAAVPTPRCWLIGSREEAAAAADEIRFPCVLKPVSSHDWRKGRKWTMVGARKAIAVLSAGELLAEYAAVAQADPRALVQELVPGGDDCLLITACYLDRQSNWVAGFAAQKLIQAPEGFGTGCVVQAIDGTELFERSRRLLETMRFSGIAEVEYKWDAASGDYQLIEINPRPWDQHRIGNRCGVDLIHLAYCEHAGLPRPAFTPRPQGQKWIAEDTFITTAARLLWRRDPKLRRLLAAARGKRLYAIWSIRDPLPFLVYMASFLPRLAWTAARQILRRSAADIVQFLKSKRGRSYERHCEDPTTEP